MSRRDRDENNNMLIEKNETMAKLDTFYVIWRHFQNTFTTTLEIPNASMN